jgi:Uma2 family endonuclease
MSIPDTIVVSRVAVPITVEEYLRREEEELEAKHEYVAGELYAMTDVRLRHARIVTNLVARFAPLTRGTPCEVVATDVKLRAAADRIYYPDLMVLCGERQEDDVVVGDPCLLVEVTSPSTHRTDRGEKLDAYRAIASLRAYLIVDHRVRRVERHWRDEAGEWRGEIVSVEQPIPIPCPETSLTLADIYEGTRVLAVGEQDGAAYGAAADAQAHDDAQTHDDA